MKMQKRPFWSLFLFGSEMVPVWFLFGFEGNAVPKLAIVSL